MPGRGTRPGPRLYEECGKTGGPRRHRREGTTTCEACREYQRQDMARYRVQRIISGPKFVPVLGTRRRVHALARRGWSQDSVASRLGVNHYSFRKSVNQAEVRREFAEKVRGVYGELAWQDGPSHLARKFAEARGWPGPMDWDDPDDPRENPVAGIVIARDHAEALEMHRLWKGRQRNEQKNAWRRQARARARAERVAGQAGARRREAARTA